MGTPLPYGSRHVGNPVFRRVLRLDRFRRPVRTVHTFDEDVSLLWSIQRIKGTYPLTHKAWVSTGFPTGGVFHLSILEFKQSSFRPVGQSLHNPLGYPALPQRALPTCYVHAPVSCRAKLVGLVGFLLLPTG